MCNYVYLNLSVRFLYCMHLVQLNYNRYLTFQAVELCRQAFPQNVITLEEEWGDWLSSTRQVGRREGGGGFSLFFFCNYDIKIFIDIFLFIEPSCYFPCSQRPSLKRRCHTTSKQASMRRLLRSRYEEAWRNIRSFSRWLL